MEDPWPSSIARRRALPPLVMSSGRQRVVTGRSTPTNTQDIRQTSTASPSIYNHPNTLVNDGPYAAIPRTVPNRSTSKTDSRRDLNSSPARGARSTTPSNMHPMGRHGSTAQGTYIPPPPPPQQNQGMIVPPPPPRPPPNQSGQGMLPPPPPGPYPGPPSASFTSAWGGHPWTRQVMPIPPPPPMQMNHSGMHSMNSSHSFHQPQTPLQTHRPNIYDTTTSEAPVMSATFIPGTDSFGPGVGIPGLGSHDDFSNPDYDVGDNNAIRQGQDMSWLDANGSDLPGYEDAIGEGSRPPPNITRNQQSTHYAHEFEKSWTTDRVHEWLGANGFSETWQKAFKRMMISGAGFLDIGLANAGRGDFEKMHNHVVPAIKDQCKRDGIKFDTLQEKEEVKRIRKLIRQLDTGVVGYHGRTQSGSRLNSAGTAGSSVEESPRITTPTTAGGGDDSPGLSSAFPASASSNRSYSFRNRKYEAGSSTPNELHSSHRQEVTRGIIRDNFPGSTIRKHSPSDATEKRGLRQHDVSKENSPSLSFATLNVSSQQDGILQRSESTNTTSSARGGGWFVPPREGSRPPPVDTSNRDVSDSAATPKDHKGFRDWFRKKRKDDGTFPAEDQDSPTSPNFHRSAHSPTMTRTSTDYMENHDHRPGSALSNTADEKYGAQHMRRTSTDKKFILATTDGLNFRLINVTLVVDASTLRKQLYRDLNVIDSDDAKIFVTEPGQVQHDEELTDSGLYKLWRSRADRRGHLLIYVRSSGLPEAALSAPLPRSNSTSLNGQAGNSPDKRRNRPDDLVLPGGFGIPATIPSPKLSVNAPLQDAAKDRLNELVQDMSGAERDALLQVAKIEYQKEVAKKQQAYYQSRKARNDGTFRRDRVIDFDAPRSSPYEDKKSDPLVPLRKPPPAPAESNALTKANSLSKKAGERISRDMSFKRRSEGHSILEEIDSRGRRKAVAPSANAAAEISAKLVDDQRSNDSPATPLSGLGYKDERGRQRRALESIDFNKASGSRGESPSSAPASPGGFTNGKNNMVFRVPDYESPTSEGKDRNDYLKLSIPSIEQLRKPSPNISPNTAVPPVRPASLASRRSYGPAYQFEEHEVEFVKTAGNNEDSASDSDSDSDDGLFARAIDVKDKKSKGKDPVARKPPLSLDTRGEKVRSVTWAPTPDVNTATDPDHQPYSSAGDSSAAPLSPDSAKMARRKSLLMRDDVWANRPPTEALINDLDTYFPNIDLDQPVLEESSDSSPPASPSGTGSSTETTSTSATSFQVPTPVVRPPSLDQGLTWQARPLSIATQAIEEESDDFDTLGSDESTLRGPAAIKSVAQRNIRKSGCLGRMKSIREVAQVANTGTRRAPSKIYTAQKSTVDLNRRKSTKMFGANIVQINPGRGSRMSLIDTVAAVPVHKRNNTYRVIRGQLIGKGTYGRVYVGINATTGEVLAIKQVEVSQKAKASEQGALKDMVASLDREIDTMQHLEHPNIVQYLGCERKDFSISIFLEYISGGSIGSCLRKHGKFEERVVSSLTRQVLAGLTYLHGQGILHRDLKADNILLDQDGTCKISDFGISKRSDNIYGNDATNSMQGSVFWMAPEVIRSQGKGYSAKVDIWSLGCVVLEMFAGRRPWAKEEAIGAIYKLGSLGQAPPIPEDVSVTISIIGLSFMMDCFTLDPGERPTADTLLDHHPFCKVDPYYNFLDTELHAKLKGIKEFNN